MEAALKELFERQTREAEIASEAMKRAEAMVARQQALPEEAEKREQELKQKLQNRLSFIDEDEGMGDSRSRTWKPSTVAGNPPAKENNKHPFSLAKKLDVQNSFGISDFHRQVHRIISSNKEIGPSSDGKRKITLGLVARGGVTPSSRYGMTEARSLDLPSRWFHTSAWEWRGHECVIHAKSTP
ncbi:hypothetical protein PIB30_038272 [Stylosanthes scabra]|uniref:Uncharacterized protein n=1 Tax=Stylosanthes scabra TaxID=79078 RepID=A0ABU6YBB7_9FABA|nr:hypothetical protein [Stylosanthes scabra]